jgi:hypothetical protein
MRPVSRSVRRSKDINSAQHRPSFFSNNSACYPLLLLAIAFIAFKHPFNPINMSSQQSPQSSANITALLKAQIVAAFQDRPDDGESKDAFKYWARNFVRAVVCRLVAELLLFG